MSDETTLLPCPWCGEYPKVAEDGGSTGPWFCVWHDCPPVEGGKARHYGESLGCISITTAWFHTEAEAIAAWNTRTAHGPLTAEQVMAIAGKHQPDYCSDTHVCFDWQAIADELNAELGSGTCEFELNTDMTAIRCDKCDYELPKGTDLKATRFCGGCGKAVKR